MKAMYSRWFQHRDGSLKTLRISLVVFVAVLVGLGMIREATRSGEALQVQVSHVFEPETAQRESETAQMEAETAQKEPETAPQAPAPEPREKVEKPVPEKTAAVEEALQEKVAAVHELVPEETGQENKAMEREPIELRVSLPGAERPGPAGNGIELASEEYLTVYEKWRRSGDVLDPDRQGMSLRIMDLEQVYDLFQMKVVAFREQAPFMDLTDNTRVAPQSLDDYSGTCFVVARPWDKWGDALSRAGFRKTDALEVRYYTYDFVRNAIFARAARAVEWSAAAGLPADVDLSRADVLGRAYGMNRSGGGAFGVFVPVQVDFGSGMSVTVDPLACFPDEPDILALNRAGLL
jgi:hypothetical protein